MNKNIFFKALTIVFVLIMFSIPTIAKSITDNSISRIVIERAGNNDYIINLLFKNNYKGNAFLQKKENGFYQVFLPDTTTKSKNTRITYKNNSDKKRIQLQVDEKPIIKGNKKSQYVKIAVLMDKDYSIKLVSGLASNYNPLTYVFQSSNIFSVGTVILLGLAIFLILQIHTQTKNSFKQSRCHTSYPASFLNSPRDYYRETIEKENIQKEATIRKEQNLKQKMNIKTTMKPADKATFDCFELPFAEDIKNTSNIYEFQSSLQQASKLLKEKPSLVKLRHTNPMVKSTNTNVSGLEMPAIEDIMQKKSKPLPKINKQEKKTPAHAELISVLNITPNKGFYLTTVDDTLALFGFINENVFLFKKFKDLSQINLQARYYDKNGDNDIYIVRLDSYKAMIEISNDSMKELAKI